MLERRYLSYSQSLIEKYGYQIYRVGVDAGFSCPNRGASRSSGGCVYCDSQGAVAAYLRTSESSFSHKSTFEENIDSIEKKIGDNTCANCFDEDNVKAQIEKAMEFLSRRYKAQHFALYLQSFSNTFASDGRLRYIYDRCLGSRNWDQFIVSTRPDCLDQGKMEVLKSFRDRAGEISVELGLQSGDDGILEKMGRGHSVRCFIDAAQLVRENGFGLCVHILTGFPGEGKTQLDRTLEVINLVHPDAIKIHNLNIASGTRLYEAFLEGEVTSPSMKRHIESTVYILRRIWSDIVIERLMCETPAHRLCSPRLFPDKNLFLEQLDRRMEALDALQGDLLVPACSAD